MSDQAREKALRPIYNALDSYQYSKALKLTYSQPQSEWPITVALRAHCLERCSKSLDACREIRILLSCLSSGGAVGAGGTSGEGGKKSSTSDDKDDDWSEIDEMIWLLGLGSEGEKSSVGTYDGVSGEEGVSSGNTASSSTKGKGKKGKGKTTTAAAAAAASNKSNTSGSGTSTQKNAVSPLDIIHVLDLPKYKVQQTLYSTKFIANSFAPAKLNFKPNDIVDEVRFCND